MGRKWANIVAKKTAKDGEDEMTADEIISKLRKASIRREFPKEYLNKK